MTKVNSTMKIKQNQTFSIEDVQFKRGMCKSDSTFPYLQSSTLFKVGLSPSKKILVICLIESLLK